MANTLTALQPILFSVAQEVSAEPFGAVGAINTSFDSKGVAVGDLVKVPVAPVRAITDFTPAATPPEGADAVAAEVSVAITASKKATMNLTGEQLRSLENGGNSQEWIRQMVAQMMRSLRNAAEVDCVNAIYQGASRAVGTAGTNPFASALTPLADVRRILLDNGAPMADLQFVGDSLSETNLLKLGVVLDASISGSDEERRSGMLRRQYGFEMRTSAGIRQHVAGAGTGYLINQAADGANELAGDTLLTLDTGTVNTTGIKAGDVVTFAADANNAYVVNTGLVAVAGDIRIGRPGLRVNIPNNNAMTIGGSYTPNLAFERSAVVGILRPPVMPANPTISQTLISDGKGMTYLLLDIAQYGQRTWELHLAWGFKAVQSEHIAILRG